MGGSYLNLYLAGACILSCIIGLCCQDVSMAEDISVESISPQHVEVTIQEGCSKLSRYHYLEIDQYEKVTVHVPDSFSQIEQLASLNNVIGFEVSPSHPEWSCYDGCLYSKDGETFLLQPFAQDVEVLRIHEGTLRIASNSLQGRIDCLILPSTLISGVDEIAFNGSFAEIQEIIVDSQNSQYTSKDGVLYSKDMKQLLYYPSARQVTSFNVPLGVEFIGNYAFACEETMESIAIPDTVSVIGDYAFWSTKLHKVEGCHGVISVGEGAFKSSLILEEVQGLEKLKTMGKEAFSETALSSFIAGQALSSISSRAFSECHELCYVSILSQATTIADDSFLRCEMIEDTGIYCFPNSYAERFAHKNGLAIHFLEQTPYKR